MRAIPIYAVFEQSSCTNCSNYIFMAFPFNTVFINGRREYSQIIYNRSNNRHKRINLQTQKADVLTQERDREKTV